jgi:F-type H+-transporting ATPase subunit delta
MFCKEQENIVDVNVHSAIPLDENYREKLLKALQKKLKRKVMLHFKEEASLIGGVILRIHDWVLDASIKGQLEKMRSVLVE